MIEIDVAEGRYARQSLITWWDQSRLAAARVLVVGAGALGNEIVKDLALVGAGHIDLIDLDIVERSNLARGVFFREADEGRPKAEVVAAAAAELNPTIEVVGHVGNVMTRGVGWIGTFDVVLGGLDNREARVWINQACRKLGVPWVDGAIEGLRGVVRTFRGAGPCYECTLSDIDREILARRRSCALLTTEEMQLGKVPTTATSASLIAAVQVQEAIRLLHGEETLHNQGWTFIGETLEAWVTGYSEDPLCPAHDRYETVERYEATTGATLRDVIGSSTIDVADMVAVDLEDDLVLAAACRTCGWSSRVERRAVDLTTDDVRCPTCDEVGALDATSALDADHPLLDVALSDIGFPMHEIITVRSQSGRTHHRIEYV